MQQSNQISINTAEGSVFPVVLGKSKEIKLNLSNTSDTERAYNISVNIELADPLEMLSSSIDVTNIVDGQNNVTTYSYINLKDLVENENDFGMDFKVKSKQNYTNGNPVEFGDKLQCVLTVTWDSMPRGSFDPGNVEYYNSVNIEYDVTMISLTKTIPSQRVKGAGTDTIAPSKIFNSVIEIQNNSINDTIFDITDLLPDGFRYIGNINIISGIQNPLPAPSVTIDSQTGEKTVKWENCSMLKGEFLKFSYQCAIWNNFISQGVENTGQRILHGTNLSTTINAKNDIFDVSQTAEIKAMDAIVTISDNSPTVDVGSTINYSLKVEVNQYYNINLVQTTAFIPDGQETLNVGEGTILPELPDNTIPVEFNVPEIAANTSWNTTLTCNVIAQYRSDSEFISCGDNFTARADMNAQNIYSQAVADSSSTSQTIIIPTLNKRVVNVFYRDMSPKNINMALASLDWVEYELTFDSSNITAVKKNILLDDFFPYDFDLPLAENVTQLQGQEVSFEDVSPHGIRWDLGSNYSDDLWKVKILTQVGPSVSSANFINLFKMSGTNHDEESYSDRTQVSSKSGKPNFKITRTYVDFTPSDVTGGVEYTCKLKVSNYQNSEGTATDAFGFQLVEQTYDGVEIVPNSLYVQGSSFYATPQSSLNFVTCQVFRMLVGQDITLTYKVTLPDNVNPGYRGNVAAQVGTPYTQIVDSLSENVLYDMSAVTSTFKLKTKNVNLIKNYTNTTLQIGDTVNYTLDYTIPQGTAVYLVDLTDTLPSDQSLTGDVYLNGELISVTTSGDDINFPQIDEIIPTDEDILYSYTFSALINDAVIEYPTTQVNEAELKFETFTGSTKKVTASKDVTIYNPLLNLELVSLNGYVLNSSAIMQVELEARNLSNIGARDCVVKIPVPNNADVLTLSSPLGNVSVSQDNSMITWDIGNMGALEYGYLIFNLKGKSDIVVFDNVVISSNSLEYKNEKSDTKLFPEVYSNILTYNCMPSVHVDVYPANKTLSGNGYYQFMSNSVIEANYSVINNSGGIDSFELEISPIKWNYDLILDDNIVASVDENTTFTIQLPEFQDLPGGNFKDFKLKIYIPELTEPTNDVFTIKATSYAGDQYYGTMETVLIDP